MSQDKPQFSSKELDDLLSICSLDNEKMMGHNKSLFLSLYEKAKNGIKIDGRDKAFLKTCIQIYRLDKKTKIQAQKLEERKKADNKAKRIILEHLKFTIGGLILADKELFNNEKMPFFLDLMLAIFGASDDERVVKTISDKPIYSVNLGHTKYEISSKNGVWSYRILGRVGIDADDFHERFVYDFDKLLSSRLEKYAK